MSNFSEAKFDSHRIKSLFNCTLKSAVQLFKLALYESKPIKLELEFNFEFSLVMTFRKGVRAIQIVGKSSEFLF